MNNDGVGSLTEWQRLSPWSMLYFMGKTLRGLLDPNIIIILAPVYGLYQLLDNPFYFALAVGIGAPALLIGSAFIQYAFYFFRVDEGNFHIRRGMLFKRQIDLPFYRIQDVHIDKPFYFKPLRLVSATLDTAGSSENEAILAAVSERFADSLREWIFAKEASTQEVTSQASDQIKSSVDSHATTDNDNQGAETQSRIILTRSAADIIVHGITNNKVWLILAALFPLLDRMLQSQWNRLVEQQATELKALLSSAAPMAYGLVALGFVALVLLMMMMSIIGSFILLYGYELSKSQDTLSRESGLFSRNQINLKIRRVQFIQIKQSLFDKFFQRFNLIYRQLDLDHSAERQTNSTFLVPSVTGSQIEKLIDIAFPDIHVGMRDFCTRFERISKRFILQEYFLKTLPLIAFTGTFVYMVSDTPHLAPIIITLLVIGFLVNCLRWLRWGYFQSEGYLFIRRGFIGKTYCLVPRFKVQQASLVQSYPMIRNGHSHVSFVVGLSGFRIPYIPFSRAVNALDQSVMDVESTRRSWM